MNLTGPSIGTRAPTWMRRILAKKNTPQKCNLERPENIIPTAVLVGNARQPGTSPANLKKQAGHNALGKVHQNRRRL